jgi:hypothetical protein
MHPSRSPGRASELPLRCRAPIWSSSRRPRKWRARCDQASCSDPGQFARGNDRRRMVSRLAEVEAPSTRSQDRSRSAIVALPISNGARSPEGCGLRRRNRQLRLYDTASGLRSHIFATRHVRLHCRSRLGRLESIASPAQWQEPCREPPGTIVQPYLGCWRGSPQFPECWGGRMVSELNENQGSIGSGGGGSSQLIRPSMA